MFPGAVSHSLFFGLMCFAMVVSVAVLLFGYPTSLLMDIIHGEPAVFGVRGLHMIQVTFGLNTLLHWSELTRTRGINVVLCFLLDFVTTTPVIIMMGIERMWLAFGAYVCVWAIQQVVLCLLMMRQTKSVERWIKNDRSVGGWAAKILDALGIILSIATAAWVVLLVMSTGIDAVAYVLSWVLPRRVG